MAAFLSNKKWFSVTIEYDKRDGDEGDPRVKSMNLNCRISRKEKENFFHLSPSLSHPLYPPLDSLNFFENLFVVTATADDDYLGERNREKSSRRRSFNSISGSVTSHKSLIYFPLCRYQITLKAH